MSYLVLARKWRPKRFAELVGQEHVVRALTNALETGRVHHAFLFTGTRGVGKTTIARIFAKSLNCERGVGAEPCGECASCLDIDAGPLRRPARDRRGQQHRRRRRPRPDRERAVHAVARPHQGLPDRRSAHAVEERVQRAAEDAGRAAGAREVPAGDHRPAEAAGDRAVALPAVQPAAPGRGADRRPDRADPAGRGHRLRAGGAAAAGARRPMAACATACRCWTRRSPIPAASSTRRGDQRDAGHGRTRAGRRAAARAGGWRWRQADGGSRRDGRSTRRTSAACSRTWPSELHRIQLHQLVPGFESEESPIDAAGFAAALSPELVQLWYQMAVNGRRDLGFAPSPRAGFEMALLRMLAFRPVEAATLDASGPPARRAGTTTAQAPSPAAAKAPPAKAESAAPAQAASRISEPAPIAATRARRAALPTSPSRRAGIGPGAGRRLAGAGCVAPA